MLTAPEQALLLALRKRLDGTDAATLRTLFYLACGLAHVEAALAAFEGLFSVLAARARRVPALHRPTCDAVSKDEWALLGLLAAHQAGHAPYAEGLARWLVPAPAAPELGRHAHALAAALGRGDRLLPLRGGNRWIPPAPAGAGVTPGTAVGV